MVNLSTNNPQALMSTHVHRYRDQLEALVQSILSIPGESDIGLRRAVAVRALALGVKFERTGAEEIPSVLERYLDKVLHDAHQVSDADVRALEQGGYSDDAIFELTLSVALGAALGRLDCGLRALYK
jgi:hypothetical protein